jgi:coenzyme F420 hydrogenase subunit beta
MAVPKFDILQYHWLGREEGYTALEHEVIFRDLCSGCGACAAVCPDEVIEVEEYPRLTGKCTNCGYCLMLCPRSFFSHSAVEERLFGKVSEELLGHIDSIVAVKATDKDIAEEGQDGGFVTALVKYLLETGKADGAIVSGLSGDDAWKAEPILATKPSELKGTGGTRYSNSPNVKLLKEAKKKGLKEIVLVGVPCQIEGFRKIQHYPIEDVDLKERVKYTVALFCKGNFLYQGLMKELLVEKYGIDLNQMTKIDIKGKNVVVNTVEEEILIPLKEAHQHLRKGCKVCFDFTSVLSDFSVGSVGSQAGYSTVITRTKEATELLDGMEAEGLVEVRDLEPGIGLVEKLQNMKERDAKRYTRRKVIEALPLPFRNLKF